MRLPVATLILSILAVTPTPLRAGDGSDGSWWHDLTCACRRERALPGQETPRSRAGHFDEADGRNLLNYPRQREVDLRHMRLDILIPDMNTPSFQAVQRLEVTAFAEPVTQLDLDAPGLAISSAAVCLRSDDSVCLAGAFRHDGRTLVVPLDPPIPPRARATVTIHYTCTDPPEGLVWNPESPAWPGRPAQLHTQGQPESNRFWFPTHDSPNERLSTELVVTVPEGFAVSSNGRLIGKARTAPAELPEGLRGAVSPDRRYATYHWLQEKPHVPYLVSLVVGKFDIVEIGQGAVPMPVYVPEGAGRLVRQTYGRTPEMVRLFERLLDEPYPWDRYAQLVVWNFHAGGMENTSATTMYDTAVLDERALLDGDLDGLISHELAHQWFGDLLTCKSWEHIWLNEGFATYFTHLWFEHRDGPEAYRAGVWANLKEIAEQDKPLAPFQPAMCSKEYRHSWETFRRAANPYPKGAGVLHMLRLKLGDEVFFRGLAAYVERHKLGLVDSDDLRVALEEASGLSLQRFFTQWCERPGLPELKVTSAYNSASGQTTISVEQRQNIDGYNPAFVLDIPLYVALDDGSVTRPWITMDTRSASISFTTPSPPRYIAVDPELHSLAIVDQEQPVAAWTEQVRAGPTVIARLRAAEALGAMDSSDVPAGATDLLASLALDPGAYHGLRSQAIETLGALGADVALDRIMSRTPDDARVRRTLVGQLPGMVERARAGGTGDPDRALGVLVRAAAHDPSYACSAAAVRGLGRLRAVEHRAVILAALATPSQHDQVRQAALEALGDLDEPESLAAVLPYTAPGNLSRTRPVAVAALARLARHDPDLAFATLSALLADREWRTVSAAGDALAALGDARALGRLERFAAEARGDVQRWRASEWVQRARAGESAAAVAPGR
ncbi:MAG TPA: M1 family aminopeptidase [Phycisphaerales bacterium]|nr:M1 family aminopeptidase [Phycisphaerales bacterium]